MTQEGPQTATIVIDFPQLNTNKVEIKVAMDVDLLSFDVEGVKITFNKRHGLAFL